MSATKFTLGPWRSVPTTTHGIDPVTIRRDIVSDGAEFAPAFVAGDITPEDAALIAAAPELYAQLEFAVKLLGGLPGFAGTAQIESMRAALTKATQS